MKMIPMWAVILSVVVPAIPVFYFGRKVMDQLYDVKPVICPGCGTAIAQTGNFINAPGKRDCGKCGTSY